MTTTTASATADVIRTAFFAAVNALLMGRRRGEKAVLVREGRTSSLASCCGTSSTNESPPCCCCCAHLDVVGVHYRDGCPSPKEIKRLLDEEGSGLWGRGEGARPGGQGSSSSIHLLVEAMQQIIDAVEMGKTKMGCEGPPTWNAADNRVVRVISVELNLPPRKASNNFDAYRSCTQRTYHYLLPILWLLDSEDNAAAGGGKPPTQRDEMRNWIQQTTSRQQRPLPSHSQSKLLPVDVAAADGGENATTPLATPQCLVKFKDALRLAESKETLSCRLDDNPRPLSLGFSSHASSPSSSSHRFGNLARNPLLPWHNFCDSVIGPESNSAATPPSSDRESTANPGNQRRIWRSVDRVRLSDLVISDCGASDDVVVVENAAIVVELKGDDFLPGQVPRIVGSAIAISRGWLPRDFFEVATRPDVVMETPSAPHGRLYFASARFHFVEKAKGSSMFSQTEPNESREEWLRSLRSRLLTDRIGSEGEERAWLNRLRLSICPKICAQLARIVPTAAAPFEMVQLDTRSPAAQRGHPVLDVSNEAPTTTAPPPLVYDETLSLLRQCCEGRRWPLTAGARSRFLRAPNGRKDRNLTTFTDGTVTKYDGHFYQCGSFLIVNPKRSHNGRKPPPGNDQFPELVKSIFELEKELIASTDEVQTAMGTSDGDRRRIRREPSSCCFVNRNASFTAHLDVGKPKNDQTLCLTVGLGEYSTGGLSVEGETYDIRYKPLEYNGWKQVHETEPFQGERFSLVWFTPERRGECSLKDGEATYEDSVAKTLVDAHSGALPLYPKLSFRRKSTDALVILEILNNDRGCAYEMSSTMWRCFANGPTAAHNEASDGFRLKGHASVLDVGAHIGVFTRYARSVGCRKVSAYEPEAHNLILLRRNLKQPVEPSTKCIDDDTEVQIHGCAVAHGESGTGRLVHAPNRNDGSLNTWRHSLEAYSNYAENNDQLPCLTRSTVPTVPFFGPSGALQRGTTFVKLDCEGAEVDILLSPDSAVSSKWLDVTHLVFEWSFTKERRVGLFHKVVQNLETAGFTVVYEGRGSWWDTDSACIWPYHNDILVFAMRHLEQRT